MTPTATGTLSTDPGRCATVDARDDLAPLDKDGRGMYKPKFDTAQNVWVETLTQAEIDALNKPATPEPTAEQQMISCWANR